ncbi:hypothetical protein H8E77_20400 [bacterium]|nr:hypothetical protein [bacterium]
MPAPTTIYFAQIAAGSWGDWVRIVNISQERSKILALARNQYGATVWSSEADANPFEAWHPPVEGKADVRGDISLEIRSDKPIAGERHCHNGNQVLDFPGASMENRTVSTRLIFPELSAGAADWVRIFNVGANEAQVALVLRDINGRIHRQLAGNIQPYGWWTVTDANLGQMSGTLEIMSTQPVVAERHMHYQGGQTAVGQLGIAID